MGHSLAYHLCIVAVKTHSKSFLRLPLPVRLPGGSSGNVQAASLA